MASLWFICPVHGRAKLARVCLRQLRRTCNALANHGIEATAVVIGSDQNLKTARQLGFGTILRDNKFLGRKYNDGMQLASDPELNPRPADYVMPIGSDDWIDYRLLLDLPSKNEIACFRNLSIVNPSRSELTYFKAEGPGGCGMRIYPRQIIEKVGYRPADEDRRRGCDTSIISNLRKVRYRLDYREADPRRIVDWKSVKDQVWPYEKVAWRKKLESHDPFEVLQGLYPPAALEEMRSL